jgi:hypothetical protein
MCLLGCRVVRRVLRPHRQPPEAKPAQQRAHRPLGQPHLEARRDHRRKVSPSPAHHTMLRQVRALADQLCHNCLLFGQQPRLGANLAASVRQARQTLGVVAVHPVPQGLPVHAAGACRIRARRALQNQGQRQHPAYRIPRPRRFPAQIRRVVLFARDQHRHHDPPRYPSLDYASGLTGMA